MLPPVCCWMLFLPVDFSGPDIAGANRKLSEWRDRPIVVLAFLGAECPAARRYAQRLEEFQLQWRARGVAIVGVDPNAGESNTAVAKWQAELGLSFPILRDDHQRLCRRLGISRTPEVVVLDSKRRLRYRGRIDDQFSPGVHAGRPGREYLQLAVTALLAGTPVDISFTEPAGCPLQPAQMATRGPVTWRQQIAPIVHRRCVSCHQPGGIGPFSLVTGADAAKHVRAIREAVAERRMPPWHADPRFGRFANDPSLTDDERRLIEQWAECGAPLGEVVAATGERARNVNKTSWSIGPPDVVFTAPMFEVPATGVLPYQHFSIQPNFSEDHWIQEAELRPGNRAVVHHATVFLRPAGHAQAAIQGELQSFSLLTFAPGTAPLVLPAGMAKKIPRGWELLIVVHYVTTGRPESDQTSLAVRFADPKTVRKEVATNLLISEDMVLPPGSQHTESRSRRFDREVLLLSLYPHMHLRGRRFWFEATYPDGRIETLLHVPRWDMDWQHRYVLAEPKFLPAGTVLTARAEYDNSADNPNNPDPAATVRVGQQTTDEMFNGYYDYCLADQDLTKRGMSVWWWLAGALGVSWVALRLRRRR